MSSYFDEASLVMIPSGYKTSKLYSVKPTDGSGDLVVSRSNDTATRVGPDGLIEKVRTNELLYSQDFTQAAWTTSSTATLSSTTTVTPAGTTDAVRVTATANTQDLRQIKTITNGLQYTNSGYIRRVSGTGTVQIIDVNGSGLNITPTSEWQRFSITATATSTTGRFYVRLFTSGDVIEVWGCQLETGDIATDYIATTTAAVSVGPVANVPRLDYLNSSCPRLLLEPQRTNLVTFSEQFDNAAWVQGRVSTTANTQVSPSGTISADTITDTVINATHRIYPLNPISVVSGTSYATSCFVKAGTSTRVEIRLMSNVESDIGIAATVFDLSDGTIVSGSGSIENYGNGWFRCTNTGTSNTTGNASPFIYLYNSLNQRSYLGTGTNTLFLWGAQVEAGAYATSYIPTLGAAVTRGADAASKTGISSLIGQTEGTVFTELDVKTIVPTSTPRRPISIEAGTDVNSLIINFATTGAIQTVLGGVTRDTGLNVSSTNGIVKIAIAYNASGFVTFVNGILRDTYTGAWTQPTWSSVGVGGSVNTATREFGDRVSQALLFKTRLSNADLAALTA